MHFYFLRCELYRGIIFILNEVMGSLGAVGRFLRVIYCGCNDCSLEKGKQYPSDLF